MCRKLNLWCVSVVLVGFSATGCKDEANPVLPPVGNDIPGLSGAGAGADAAPNASDTAANRIPDLAVEAPAADGKQTACSLLKQDCPTGDLPLQACYPVGTLGRCLIAGSAAPMVGCAEVNDCEKGTVCVPDAQTGMGICFSLCNRSDTSMCGKNNVCAELRGFSDVGYCLQL